MDDLPFVLQLFVTLTLVVFGTCYVIGLFAGIVWFISKIGDWVGRDG